MDLRGEGGWGNCVTGKWKRNSHLALLIDALSFFILTLAISHFSYRPLFVFPLTTRSLAYAIADVGEIAVLNDTVWGIHLRMSSM